MNYEVEFEEMLLNLIKKNYNTKFPIKYMIMRYMIYNNIKKISKINLKKFEKFLLEHNNLPEKLIYKDTKISLNYSSSSLYTIVNNWIFELEKDRTLFNIEKEIEIINKQSASKTKRFKKVSYYSKYLLLTKLKALNILFKIDKIVLNNKIDNLYYEKFEEKFSLEQILEIEINKVRKYSDNYLITEKQLEDYLKYHLCKIEDGLTYISSQYIIENALIDILAEDKNGKKVIIELKVVPNDERVVWQSLYYPKQYEKENKINCRMIIVSPKIQYSILSVLEALNVDLYFYTLELDKDLNINNIFIEKYKNKEDL